MGVLYSGLKYKDILCKYAYGVLHPLHFCCICACSHLPGATEKLEIHRVGKSVFRKARADKKNHILKIHSSRIPHLRSWPTSNFGPVNCGYYLDGKEKTLVIHLGTSSVVVLVGILPESIDRGYFAVVQKFSQETARGAAVDCWTRLSLSLSLPNCVINSIWEQDTNERARCIIWPHPPRWWQQQLAI